MSVRVKGINGKANPAPFLKSIFVMLGLAGIGASLFLNLGEREALSVGKKAPEIKSPIQDGSVVRLSDFRGTVVFLNFWADW